MKWHKYNLLFGIRYSEKLKSHPSVQQKVIAIQRNAFMTNLTLNFKDSQPKK